MLKALDISTSALVAQRVRLNAIAGNVANMSSVRNERGELQPYQERFVVFQPDDALQTKDGAIGVKVSSVQSETREPNYRYQPGHPLARLRCLSKHRHDESICRLTGRDASLRSQPGCHGSDQEYGRPVLADHRLSSTG